VLAWISKCLIELWASQRGEIGGKLSERDVEVGLRHRARGRGHALEADQPFTGFAPRHERGLRLGDAPLLLVDPTAKCVACGSTSQGGTNLFQAVDSAWAFERLPLFGLLSAGEPLLRCLAQEMSKSKISTQIVDVSPFRSLQEID